MRLSSFQSSFLSSCSRALGPPKPASSPPNSASQPSEPSDAYLRRGLLRSMGRGKGGYYCGTWLRVLRTIYEERRVENGRCWRDGPIADKAGIAVDVAVVVRSAR